MSEQKSTTNNDCNNSNSSLQTAAQKLLAAINKHHPLMNMDTQLDLYMAYHEVREALEKTS